MKVKKCRYIAYKSELTTKMGEIQLARPQLTDKDNKNSAAIKLPTINIPTFSGKYT